MQAMVCEGAGRPLALRTLPRPEPGPGQVQIAVRACGVCRTDLHLVDGELPRPQGPGDPRSRDRRHGRGARTGRRHPRPRRAGRRALAGRQLRALPLLRERAREPLRRRALHRLPAGRRLRGVRGGGRALRLSVARPLRRRPCRSAAVRRTDRLSRLRAWPAKRTRSGIYGFGAAAHLVAQIALAQGRIVFAFTRPGDGDAQAFARKVGVQWAGGSDATPPAPLDAALIFAPVGPARPGRACRDRARRHRRLRRAST